MRQLLQITKRGAALLPGRAAATPPAKGADPAPQATTPEAPEPKAPPGLSLAFMLSHLEDDGPVRLDGQKLGVCEVLGLELDEPKLGAFAGALNACDFPLQLLVRQHPPGLGKLRDDPRTSAAGGSAAANEGGGPVPAAAAGRAGDTRGHPRPSLLRRV